MKGVTDFGELINEKIKSHRNINCRIGKVVEVDWDNKTCDVEVDGVPYLDVKLGLGSIIKKPSVGSIALIGIIENNEGDTILVDSSSLEEILINSNKIVFNDGVLGGLIDVNKLKAQIEKNTQVLRALQNAINSFIPVPSDGGAKFKADLIASGLTSANLADMSDIENENFSHG